MTKTPMDLMDAVMAPVTDAERAQTLRVEASFAGDLEMVTLCDRAIAGDEVALVVCATIQESEQLRVDIAEGRRGDITGK